MMLNLPTVTLVAVDTFHPELTLKAMESAMSQVGFADRVLVCKTGFEPAEPHPLIRLHFVDHEDRLSRELFLIREMWSVFSTSHCLHMEWDSGIKNVSAWNPQWLKLDFIGAPWSDTNDAMVGNFGFSLASRRFFETVAVYADPSDGQAMASDLYMCFALRQWLEKAGIRFATAAEANRFSCENRPYDGQFGFHGSGTANLNGWKL